MWRWVGFYRLRLGPLANWSINFSSLMTFIICAIQTTNDSNHKSSK